MKLCEKRWCSNLSCLFLFRDPIWKFFFLFFPFCLTKIFSISFFSFLFREWFKIQSNQRNNDEFCTFETKKILIKFCFAAAAVSVVRKSFFFFPPPLLLFYPFTEKKNCEIFFVFVFHWMVIILFSLIRSICRSKILWFQ